MELRSLDLPKLQVTEKGQFIDQIFMLTSSILTDSKDSVKHFVAYIQNDLNLLIKIKAEFKHSVVGYSSLQFVFNSTYLVEENVRSVPRYWKHAPNQKQTLHHKISGEGVTKNQRKL